MKKLSLDLDSLEVQSFATSTGDAAGEGTVLAFAKTQPTGPDDPNCSHIDACASALGCTQFDCDTYDRLACRTAECDTLEIGC